MNTMGVPAVMESLFVGKLETESLDWSEVMVCPESSEAAAIKPNTLIPQMTPRRFTIASPNQECISINYWCKTNKMQMRQR